MQNRAYFKKAGHAHGMSEIGIIIESLGQFQDVTTPLPPRQDSMQIQSFWRVKIPKNFKKVQ